MAGRKVLLLTVVLLVGAVSLTAFLMLRPVTSVPPIAQVNLASFSRAIDYAPYLIARDQGRFDAALKPLGATATYQEFGNLADLTSAAASSRVDIIFEAEPPAIITRSSGVDLRIVGIDCTLRQEILVLDASNAKTIADLKGDQIAVLSGTSSQYGLLHNLEEAGLKPSDVNIVDLAPPIARAAFDAGKVDAWAVWPPFVEQEVIAKRGRVLPGGTAEIQSIVTMTGSFVLGHRELALAIMKVLDDTKDWMHLHPSDAQVIVAKQLGVTPDVVAMAWPKHNWAATLDSASIVDLQNKADFLITQKLITNKVSMTGGMVAPLTN